MQIAVNGLGRIGRLVVRAAMNLSDIKVAAVNSIGEAGTIAHLLNYDSIHGELVNKFQYIDGYLCNSTSKVRVYKEDQPANISWGKEIDVVFECSGKFNSKDLAVQHLASGPKKVIISAPCNNADATIIVGVNDHILKREHNIISVGSCTTNALAPIAKVLNDEFGIECGYVTTVHAYTSDQNILDNSHKDLRRARACALSIIPTKTGAAKSLNLVIPELAGRLDGSAIRVPTPNVSLIDFTFYSKNPITKDYINYVVEKSTASNMKNIIAIAQSELVSMDFNNSKFSSIFDPFETKVVGEKFGRVVSWYDNEWGFVNRMLDVCKLCKNL